MPNAVDGHDEDMMTARDTVKFESEVPKQSLNLLLCSAFRSLAQFASQFVAFGYRFAPVLFTL